MTTYRFAQAEDIPSLVEFGRGIHAESRYAWMRYQARRVWTMLEEALERKQFAVLVAVQESEFVGILFARAEKFLFNDDFSAQIQLLYVVPRLRGSPAAMQLLGAFRRWAQNRSVTEVWLIDNFNNGERGSREFLVHIGMNRSSEVFSMWIDR